MDWVQNVKALFILTVIKNNNSSSMLRANLQVPHLTLRSPLRERMGKVKLREGEWLAKVPQVAESGVSLSATCGTVILRCEQSVISDKC